MCQKLILVIDHEPSVRSVLQTCLYHLAGWNVLAVSDPAAAIALMVTCRPDAVLLDLPQLEQEAILIATLNQYPVFQTLPLLLISARADWYSHAQLHTLGIRGAIAKPFDASTLPYRVAQLLGWSTESLV